MEPNKFQTATKSCKKTFIGIFVFSHSHKYPFMKNPKSYISSFGIHKNDIFFIKEKNIYLLA